MLSSRPNHEPMAFSYNIVLALPVTARFNQTYVIAFSRFFLYTL